MPTRSFDGPSSSGLPMMAAGGPEEGPDPCPENPKPRPSCVAIVPYKRMYEFHFPPMLVLTYAIFTVPTIMIWVNVLPYCSWTICICSPLVYLFTIGSLTMTAFIDPGVVTRETRFGPNTRLVYCSACDLWRPRSAEHCEDCDVCCVGYDHHCPWTGKCIAAGNVCYFYVFLASVVVIMVFSMFVGLGTPLPRTRK